MERVTVTADRDVADDIRAVVHAAHHNTPRQQQTALGPSQIGEPCARRLAYALMHHPASNRGRGDPWPSVVGTAVHAWLADAFETDNIRIGRNRWLVEQPLTIRPGLVGTCDLYDVDRAMVIDHKVLGVTSLNATKRDGPSAAYRVQIQLYGLGYQRLGLPVREVALAVYPRAGMLTGLWTWTTPYDETAAQAALARHDTILELVSALDVDHHPGRYISVPRTPGRSCTYCPWWRPGADTGDGCPGDTETP